LDGLNLRSIFAENKIPVPPSSAKKLVCPGVVEILDFDSCE